jgi:hypothetical protein
VPGISARHALIAVIVIAAVVWIVISNMPPPQRPAEVKVIKINATQPAAAAAATAAAPPAAPAASVTGLFACPHDAFRTRSGVIVCGVAMVTDQYVMIQRGWVWASNATAIRLVGDISACSIRLGVSTMYLDCAQPVMVLR